MMLWQSRAARPYGKATQNKMSRSKPCDIKSMSIRQPVARASVPMDVVEAAGIPISEKLSILKAWEADERALQRAEDEGMGGGEHAHLQRVHEALAKLQSQLRVS